MNENIYQVMYYNLELMNVPVTPYLSYLSHKMSYRKYIFRIHNKFRNIQKCSQNTRTRLPSPDLSPSVYINLTAMHIFIISKYEYRLTGIIINTWL